MFKKILAGATVASLALMASSAFASTVPNSGGSVILSDGPNAEGLFFEATVNYEVFSGTSAGDPLGITPGQTQYAFIIEYVDGNEPISALDLESIFGVPITGVYTSTTGTVNGVASGDVLPSAKGLVTLNGNSAARFLFQDEEFNADFGPGDDVSAILVFTAASATSTVDTAQAGIRDSSLSDAALVVGPKPKTSCPPPHCRPCRPRPCHQPRHCDRSHECHGRHNRCNNNHGGWGWGH